MVIWFIFGTVIRYLYIVNACKISLDSLPNLSNYGHLFIHLCICCDILKRCRLILVIYSTIIRCHVLQTYVKYNLALCNLLNTNLHSYS